MKEYEFTAKNLKRSLISHLHWRLHYPIVIDEFNFMDIFAIRRTGYMVEFEIKVSKSDLMREIKLLNCEQPQQYTKDWTKWQKHSKYLGREVDKEKLSGYGKYMIELFGEPAYFMPNEFYFYVPDFLADIAIEKTKDTPYGVVKIGKKQSGNPEYFYHSDYDVIKPAKKLHKNIADAMTYKSIAHGLTARNKIMISY